MATAGEKATYETFLTFTNQLVLLGRNSFHVLMIRTWNERIDYLVKANNFLDCLGPSMFIYPKLILNLSNEGSRMKHLLSSLMV